MSAATATLNNPDAFAFICGLVHDRSAIVLEPSKAYLVDARLMPIARQHGLTSLGDLVDVMKRPGSHELQRHVVEAMTTNETSFFRDIHPFEALEKKLLPELLARRSGVRTLNIWSNACSSGQEPYSIAMLLREHFPELQGWKVRPDRQRPFQPDIEPRTRGSVQSDRSQSRASVAVSVKVLPEGGIAMAHQGRDSQDGRVLRSQPGGRLAAIACQNRHPLAQRADLFLGRDQEGDSGEGTRNSQPGWLHVSRAVPRPR